jgi:hypothetical protein
MINEASRYVLTRWVQLSAIANRPVTAPFDLLINAKGVLSIQYPT